MFEIIFTAIVSLMTVDFLGFDLDVNSDMAQLKNNFNPIIYISDNDEDSLQLCQKLHKQHPRAEAPFNYALKLSTGNLATIS